VRDVDGMVNDIIPLMCSPPLTFAERMMDPMLIDALLIGQRPGIEGDTSTFPCPASRHSSTEEIHSPVLLRSEVEQLVRQELIKALVGQFLPLPKLSNPSHM
jgi:hypothetical protein